MSTQTRAVPLSLHTFEISGAYAAKNHDNTVSEKPFKLTVTMLHELVQEGALSIFKNEIAPEEMPKHYPDFAFLRKYRITKSECTNPAILARKRDLMTFDQLVEVCQTEGYREIDFDLYNEPAKLVSAMNHYEQNKTDFLKWQKVRQEEKEKELRIKRLVRESKEAIGKLDLSALAGI